MMDFEMRHEARDDGQSANENRETLAVILEMPGSGLSGDHGSNEDHGGLAAASETIAVIQQLWRRRQKWHQAEKSLTLQCSAICRGMAGDRMAGARMLKRIEDGEPDDGDLEAMIATAPLLSARSVIRAERLATEKVLEKLARSLPVRAWTKTVYGIGDLSLAAIVGEAGDVGSYKSVAALWKRMGLAVINGERQRKKAGDEAFDHGYSPRRRAVMWNIGGALIGGMGKGPRLYVGETLENRPDLSQYQRLFYERLKYEVARNPEMQREPTICPKTGKLRESFSAHAVNRAKRYVEKRFLRNLFAEWRAAKCALKSKMGAPLSHQIPPNGGAESHNSGETRQLFALGTSNPS